MNTWFLLALGSAISSSGTQALQKLSISRSGYSRWMITFIVNLIGSSILFTVSYFIGFPELQAGFWLAIIITGILNVITFPVMLRAYEIGEFSSVYSMILLTPVFLFITSFIFLKELPSVAGFFGVILTIFGLWLMAREKNGHDGIENYVRGNALGMLVALIWSVSINFDKLATRHSDAFFAPAVGMMIIFVSAGVYLILRGKTLLFNKENNIKIGTAGIVILLALGISMALSNVLHNSALLYGFATYTIAIKCIGILFGVLWGWLFFKEKNLRQKLTGAGVAVAGVAMILLA